MRNSEQSTRVIARGLTFIAVFFAPAIMRSLLGDSVLTALWGLVSLAAAAAVMCLVSLCRRIGQLEKQTALLQDLVARLERESGSL